MIIWEIVIYYHYNTFIDPKNVINEHIFINKKTESFPTNPSWKRGDSSRVSFASIIGAEYSEILKASGSWPRVCALQEHFIFQRDFPCEMQRRLSGSLINANC